MTDDHVCYVCGSKRALWGFGPPGWHVMRWTCREHRFHAEADLIRQHVYETAHEKKARTDNRRRADEAQLLLRLLP